MSLFQLQKHSLLVNVSTHVVLSELKRRLISEGLYLGYSPLDDLHHTLEHYLNRRTLNLYHFRYGSLADLISSMHVNLPNNKKFHLKDAPRAAIGPDFNRMLVGSRKQVGEIESVTLKTQIIPDSVLQAIILVPNKDQAKKTIQTLIGQFIQPMYFRYFDLQAADPLLNDLKIKSGPTEVLLICLSGLRSIVATYQNILDQLIKSQRLKINWLKKRHHKVIHTHLHTPESYREITDQYRQFLWPAAEGSTQMQWEKDYFDSESSIAQNVRTGLKKC